MSNLIAKDGGKQIVAGNEKVIRARLSDAKFFWEQDLKKPLDEMAAALAGITFHEKLGTQKERVERIAELALPDRGLGGCGAGGCAARGAARQGRSRVGHGRRVPRAAGPDGPLLRRGRRHQAEIARAIELHYKPKGPTDTVPKAAEGDAVAIAVALADKLDTLVGFWAIGEKPTGSGDPYQLRRAALGVIRIVLENDLRLPLRPHCRMQSSARSGSTFEQMQRELGDRLEAFRAIAKLALSLAKSETSRARMLRDRSHATCSPSSPTG